MTVTPSLIFVYKTHKVMAKKRSVSSNSRKDKATGILNEHSLSLIRIEICHRCFV